MGPSTINSFCQSSLGSKQWNYSIINRIIRQWSICYSWYVKDSIGALCTKMSQIGLKNCKWGQTAKSPYVDPDPSQGSIITDNPMDLLCIDFMKVVLSKHGKENDLVMTAAFSVFSVAVVMPNQKVKTVAKALEDKWFYTNGIPFRIHSNQGKRFDNKIIEKLCKIYGVKQSTTTPYNPHGNWPWEQLNYITDLLKTLPKDQKPNWPAHLGTLVFAYNATLHSTTWYQPSQLMFVLRLKQLVITSWGCPSTTVVRLSQKIYGYNNSLNWYGLQTRDHWETFDRACRRVPKD